MKPYRRASQPVLIYCEGLHDAVFMRYLKEIYGNQNTGKSFDIKPGAGGSASTLVGKAVRVAGGYDTRVVKCDNDRGKDEHASAEALATKLNVILRTSQPCIEALFLRILAPEQNMTGATSQKYKNWFEATYMSAQSRTRVASYHQVFPRSLLDGLRGEIKELDDLIRVFE